jgi:pSer/pThr/pTyr-binding forkhead associated (FHA) protein
MSVRLVVKLRSEANGAETSSVVLLDQDPIVMGRDKSCQVLLAQQAVSRSHARISRDGALFFIEDLGSSYGTRINGKSLPRGEKRLLRNGDIIAIAQYDLTFDHVADVPKEGEGSNTSNIARQVMKDALRGLNQSEGPCFRVMNGPKEGQRIEIADAQEIVFGRDETADIVLKDDMVSRRHAKVRRDWSGTHVEDLKSRNGIKVNRKRVMRKTLRDRDELEIGGIRLLYLDPSDVRETPIVMEPEGEATVHQEEQPEPPKEAEPPPAEEAAPPPVDPASASAGAAEPPTKSEVPDATDPPPEEAAPGPDAPVGYDSDVPMMDEPPPPSGGLVSRFAMLTGIPRSKALAPLVAAGVLALVAIIVIIALIAGA